MAQNKKDFTTEAANVFVSKMITPVERSRDEAAKKPGASKAATEIKVCYMLDAEVERKLRYIAFAERSKQKTIVTDALLNYIADYEKLHGKIK